MAMLLPGKARGSERIIAALDVGTSKVCCMIAAIPAASMRKPVAAGGVPSRLLGLGLQQSKGVKAGVVVDLAEAEDAIRAAVGRAEAEAGLTVGEVHVTVSCGRLNARCFSANAAVKGAAVSEADLERALSAGRAFAEKDGRRLLHLHRLGYRLDNEEGIRNPLGMAGEKLSVALTAVTADEGPLRNLLLLIQRCYLSVAGLVATPYASALAVLSDEEADQGSVVIDLGGGTTTLAVFDGGHLLHVDALAIGGNHVSYDIARALSAPLQEAERIKTLYGNLVGAASDAHELIAYAPAGTDGSSLEQTTRAELRRIVAPRVEEMLGLVRDRLERSGCAAIADRHIVLTGGASQMAGLREFAARGFASSVRIGAPRPMAGMPQGVPGPALAAVAGVMHALVAPGAGLRWPEEAAGSLRRHGYLGTVGRWLRESFWDEERASRSDGA